MLQTPNKSLNLPALESASGKVTLGFRCHAAEKLRLAQEAQSQGLNLSEYVESLIAIRHQPRQNLPDTDATEQTRGLKAALDFYEKEPLLLEMLRATTGQTTTFKAANGQTVNITIRNVKDVFTVLVNSFRKGVSHV